MKYWVYLDGEVPGSYEPHELARVPGFGPASLVCPAEGSPAERNWRRAGLFTDIASALQDRQQAQAAPAEPPPLAPISPGDILGETSQKLFRHVTELMKELENRREERALAQSLQRALAETKNELLAARERIRYLEDRASLIPGFEDRERKLQELLTRTRADLLQMERQREEATSALDEARRLAETATRGEAENRRLAALTDDLSRQLADKELSLAKALGVLGRLESELGRIVPAGPAGSAREIPGETELPEIPRLQPAPPPPPRQAPKPAHDEGKMQSALDVSADFFKKNF